jgi:hypothetical protein
MRALKSTGLLPRSGSQTQSLPRLSTLFDSGTTPNTFLEKVSTGLPRLQFCTPLVIIKLALLHGIFAHTPGLTVTMSLSM